MGLIVTISALFLTPNSELDRVHDEISEIEQTTSTENYEIEMRRQLLDEGLSIQEVN
jgi:hypothetical protein